MASTNPDGNNSDRKDAIARFLSSKGIPPKPLWLSNFLESATNNPHIGALQQSAQFKLLNSDFTTCIQSSATNTLPSDVNNPHRIEFRLSGPIPVQVMDIEDIGSSVWSQIEALEAQERGETTRGGEIVRNLPAERNEVIAGTDIRTTAHGPHKLLLQDAAGTIVYAFEQVRIDKVGLDMSIGSKFVLKNVLVARGLILLEPKNVEFLGGKLESLDRAWKAEKKQRLQQRVSASTD